jgi:GNAT superfamily N-acetyltransferase
MMMDVLRKASNYDLAHAIEANMFEQYPFLYGILEEAEIHCDAEISWIITRQPYSQFNIIYSTKYKNINVDKKVTDVVSYFKSLDIPFKWIVGPSAEPKNIGHHLKRHGCELKMDEAGMAIDLNLIEKQEVKSSDLKIEEVNDMETLGHWFIPVAEGFQLSESMIKILYKCHYNIGFQNDNWRLYVGYMNGIPVAASNLFMAAGVAGIYHVATLHEYRKRGIGTAITLIPLKEAKKMGIQYGVLRATQLGEHVYKKLGFEEYCRIQSWQYYQ